jgi:hypothetical protein
VFSFDMLRVGDAQGLENYTYTAGDVIFPQAGVDPGTYYKFVVTDSAGAIRNPSFPCTPAADFSSANNTYSVAPTDPASTGTAWRFRLNQYNTANCGGAAAKTTFKSLYVAKATAYANSALTVVKSSFTAGETAYVSIQGVKSNAGDWSTTWLLPSSGTACANTAGADRPESSGSGRLPKSTTTFLQYRPNVTSTGSAWNRESNYETRPCVAFGSTNDGAWKLQLRFDAINFVSVNAFTVDALPPPTPTIDSGPPDPSNSASATFTFSDSEAGVGFRCQLDGGGFVPCSSPESYSGLAEGSHSFQVKARDGAGNESAAVTRSWTVDTLPPPAPTIDSGPPDPSNSASATFAFSDSEAGVSFRCQLDGAGFGPCTSPQSYGGLAEGSHSFQVKARDVFGRESAPATRSWTVDTQPPPTPTIDSGPPDPSNSASATFTFSDSEAGVSFRCQLDGAGFGPCTSPQSYGGLAEGPHSFQLKARDGAGNESTPASYGWTVDAIALPPPTIDSGPPDPSNSASATFAFSHIDSNLNFLCQLDSGGFAPCTSPLSYGGLAEGSHSFQVKARDVFGRESAPASRSWTVDTQPPPTPTIDTGPPDPSDSASATFAFSDSEAGVSFRCQLDGAGFGACTSPQSYGGLAEGPHSFQLKARDGAGNESTAASRSWTVDFTITGYREAVLADSPSGYWRLGEASGTTAVDETTNHSNGTYLSGVALGVPGALVTTSDTAARFDGVDDRVSMGDPANGALDFGTGNFSVEAWVKTTVNGEETIVSKQPSTGRYWQITVTDDTSHVGQVRATIDDGAWHAAYGPSRVDDGNWHQVVVVFARASGITIYVDGTSSRFTAGAAPGDISNSAPFLIGKATGYAYFRGDIDEVSVFRSALSPQQVQAHFDNGTGGDRTRPTVSLTIPANNAVVVDTTPTFSGTSSTDAGDSTTVQVRVFAGTTISGPLVATARATADENGAWAVDVSSLLPPGTYTARAEQSDSAGNIGFSEPATFTVVEPPPPGPEDPIVLAAGDIVNCYGSGDEATAALLDQFPNAIVATLGDHVYEEGTAQQFAQCYEPSWGRAKARTRPAVGDHEYLTPRASGYFNYFNAQLAPFGQSATDPTKGWYSYDLGSWHVVVLNGTCAEIGGCGAGSPEEQFVRNDLAAHPAACTLVTVHKPRWSSGPVHGGEEQMDAIWRAFYDAGVDLVLGGDDHDFERFAPQTPIGTLDLTRGITQFVVGTGGRLLYLFENAIPQANSEVRNDDAFGVLKVTLRDGSYDWQFLPEAGKTFTDFGSRPCH